MAKRRVSLSSCLCLLLSSVMGCLHLAEAKATTPIFIFGDSTLDVGTNNFLNGSEPRANFPPNGIDFPDSIPTGRFSNGYNTADFLAKMIDGATSPPPYLSLAHENADPRIQLLRGVNFASGGCGILRTTGKEGEVVPFSRQVLQFQAVRSDLQSMIGSSGTDSRLSKSFFLISVGSNDLFEYFSKYGTLNKDEFVATLMAEYGRHLKNLYYLGARKFGVISAPPIGCCPSMRIRNPRGECIEDLNEYSRTFFLRTQGLLQSLSAELKGMKFSLGNTYEMTKIFMDDPLAFKFTNVTNACCGSGRMNAEQACVPGSSLCSNRDGYLFWDLFHPTEAAAELAARTFYGGEPRFVTPVNFSNLAADHS